MWGDIFKICSIKNNKTLFLLVMWSMAILLLLRKIIFRNKTSKSEIEVHSVACTHSARCSAGGSLWFPAVWLRAGTALTQWNIFELFAVISMSAFLSRPYTILWVSWIIKATCLISSTYFNKMFGASPNYK